MDNRHEGRNSLLTLTGQTCIFGCSSLLIRFSFLRSCSRIPYYYLAMLKRHCKNFLAYKYIFKLLKAVFSFLRSRSSIPYYYLAMLKRHCKIILAYKYIFKLSNFNRSITRKCPYITAFDHYPRYF